MTISGFNLFILIFGSFVLGCFIGNYYGKTYMNDMFCIFLGRQKNREELLEKYKVFLRNHIQRESDWYEDT